MKKFKKIIILSLLSINFLVLIPIFTQNIENDKSIIPYEISHTYDNFKLKSGTSFHTNINLSKDQPYGKVHFYNSSSSDATLYVEGQGTVIVKPYSSNYILWEKDTIKNKYDISITAKSGNLNSIITLLNLIILYKLINNGGKG